MKIKLFLKLIFFLFYFKFKKIKNKKLLILKITKRRRILLKEDEKYSNYANRELIT